FPKVIPLNYAPAPPESQRPLSHWFPHNAFAAAAMAILAPLPFAAGLVFLAARVFRDYGWGIFVGLPFAIGLVSSVLYGYRIPRSFLACIGIGCLSLIVCGGALISLAI